MDAQFLRLKLHCGAIAERRLDCKGLIIFLFCKFPWYQITHVWQWLQRRFCNLVSITLKFVTGSRNNYWSYCHQSESRSAFGNISLGIISIFHLAHFFFTHLQPLINNQADYTQFAQILRSFVKILGGLLSTIEEQNLLALKRNLTLTPPSPWSNYNELLDFEYYLNRGLMQPLLVFVGI